MVIDLAILAIINLLFTIVGYQMGRGTLQDKMKKVFQIRRQDESTTGPVLPLSPKELSKKQGKELMNKFT